MISFLRHFIVDSWIGRAIAGLIFIAFVGWGVGDVLGNLGESADVAASVGSRKITAAELAEALQRQLPELASQIGVADYHNIPAIMRPQMARQVLASLIGQAELLEMARRQDVVVPDDAVREQVFALPYFHGPDGNFDRKLMDQRLAQQGMTEQHLLDLIREDMAIRSFIVPLSGGAKVADSVVDRIYQYETETRSFDIVRIPFAAQDTLPEPEDAVLKRYYNNHPWQFRTPEYRHAKIVVLSADTIGRSMTFTDEELKKVYDFQSSRFHVPELRSVQIITAPDQKQADAIAALWKGGADWAKVQAASKNLAAVEFPDARPDALPSEGLRKAVFGAPADEVEGPVKVDTGWVVFRVTKVTPAHDTDFNDAKPELQEELVKARAPEQVSQRVSKLQDAIAGGGIDQIPSDIGAAAASGYVDAAGMTKSGEEAPVPASGAVRAAVVARIFAQDEKTPPTLIEVPGEKGHPSEGWYAVSVDGIEPGHMIPFEDARAKVLAAWRDAARQHAADVKATSLYIAAKGNAGGVAAVSTDGTPVHKGLMLSLAHPSSELPQDMVRTILAMPAGSSVMGEDAGDYVVVTVTGITHPDPKLDSTGVARVRDGMSETLSDDVMASFVKAISDQVKPKINPQGVSAALAMAGLGGNP
ncbi:MAG: peptidyl-prolyl cis-trans isomerase [Acetobacter sp.]|jgi:peptidyl-prolyl cis-trans isomerase D